MALSGSVLSAGSDRKALHDSTATTTGPTPHAFPALLFAVLGAALALLPSPAHAQPAQQVVDIPTRPGITQRALLVSPAEPQAAVILLAGGHGGLQIRPDGSMQWGAGNFLVRSRRLFADQGLLAVVLDAPSDRQSPPFLQGHRQRPDHVADLKAVIDWTRRTARVPVWLVGTSRGTQSAAYVATELTGTDGPDGLVLTSTILTDHRGRPVPAMPLGRIRIPVLVVHHEEDACPSCLFTGIPDLMNKLAHWTTLRADALRGNSRLGRPGALTTPRSELIAVKGGDSRGDPCGAFAHHGFMGREGDVVRSIAAWIRGDADAALRRR